MRRRGRQLALFLCLGLVATGMHVVIAAYLIGAHVMTPPLGNGIAFVFANLFSYFAQSAYVFQRAPTRYQYWRFLSVSLVGLAVVVAISTLLAALRLHYLVGIVAVVSIVPFLTFMVHSAWTFGDRSTTEARRSPNRFAKAGRWTA